MRRRLLGCAMALGTGLAAESAAQTPVGIGATLGLGSSTIAWDPTPLGDELTGVERRRGPTFGALLTVGGPGGLTLRGEVLYRDKGFGSEGDPDERIFLDIGYLEVPLLLGVALASGGPLVPELYGGGWFAWELGCDASITTPTVEASFDCDETPDGPIERQTSDYGLAAGASVTARDVGPVDLLVDVRWTVGLRNIDGGPDIDNQNVRFRTWSASVGFVRRMGG